MLPVEARLLLGSSYFNLTCRMHPGVSSFQMGVPAICLSYSVKYEGVISEGLGLSELVIDAKGEDKWENIVIHSVKEKIDYIENNYEDLNRKIMVAVDNCKIEVEEMLNAIAGDING